MLTNFYLATACNATHGIAEDFLSVKRVHCDKMKEIVPIFLHHMKWHSS